MSVSTEKNGQIQKRRDEEPATISLLKASSRAIAQALPRHVPADRFARIALTALRANVDLQRTDPSSFLACLLQAAQLGLEPNTPLQHAFLIPRRKGDSGMECTLQIGYQGMLDLARRSGRVKSITAHVVYASDRFSYTLGDDERIEHVPNMDGARGDVVYAYAIATLDDGSKIRRVVPRWEIDKARALGARNGPWVQHYDEMARKTAVRRLYKMLPKSAEMAAASQIEDASERGISSVQAVSAEVRELAAEVAIALPAPVVFDAETGEVEEHAPANAPVD
jgi:recombination protein RecT